MSSARRPSVPATAVAASPIPADKILKSRFSDQSLERKKSKSGMYKASQRLDLKKDLVRASGVYDAHTPVINISVKNNNITSPSTTIPAVVNTADAALADELDYITVTNPNTSSIPDSPTSARPDKAARILGIRHRKSMEPIPASTRNSIMSTRSLRDAPPLASFIPTLPLTSLYVVSGLPKSPHTWTLADPDSVLGLHHSESAVNRWWRPEVLGSTVSPGAGGSKKKKRGAKNEEIMKGAGALSKQEVGKMLSKALKVSRLPFELIIRSIKKFKQLSFTREVEVIASTLQPASTIHTFTFTLPAPHTPLAPTPSGDLLRASVLSNADHRFSAATFAYPYAAEDPFARPSSAYLGPPSLLGHPIHNNPQSVSGGNSGDNQSTSNTVTYHGVCLTVWSHADAERSSAIRRTLEVGRSRKESAQSMVASRLKNLRADVSGSASDNQDPTSQARRSAKRSSRGPWVDAETDGETEAEGAISESDFELSTVGHGPGESTLFLPGDTVFWLPYALSKLHIYIKILLSFIHSFFYSPCIPPPCL
jgi:nicotinamide N-methyltransferase